VTAVETMSDTFAANRARGQIALAVAAESGRTRRTRVHEQGSLRVRFPNTTGAECEAVLVNTAGGVAGGDRYDLDIALDDGTRLVVTGAASEKIYRSLGPDAELALKLKVGDGAQLRWLPQETIVFDAARLTRSIDIELAAGASLTLVEAIVFGRAAMGERVETGKLVDRWRVRRAGRLVFAETLRLDGDLAESLAASAGLNGGAALATILLAPGDEERVAALRACDFSGEAGVSAWNGIALARFCARDGATLRRDLITALAALSADPLPRLWLN
jgi:urease accessory protein